MAEENIKGSADPIVGQTILPSIFGKASRMKLRFDTVRGSLSVEELWDVPLVDNGRSLASSPASARISLDNLAMSLNKQLKEAPTESFVLKTKRPNERLELQFAIVKHIIDVKLEEAETAQKAREKSATKQRIMEILNEKKDESLKSKSAEELEALLATM